MMPPIVTSTPLSRRHPLPLGRTAPRRWRHRTSRLLRTVAPVAPDAAVSASSAVVFAPKPFSSAATRSMGWPLKYRPSDSFS